MLKELLLFIFVKFIVIIVEEYDYVISVVSYLFYIVVFSLVYVS